MQKTTPTAWHPSQSRLTLFNLSQVWCERRGWIWNRILTKTLFSRESVTRLPSAYGHPFRRLRCERLEDRAVLAACAWDAMVEAAADHLASASAVRCEPEAEGESPGSQAFVVELARALPVTCDYREPRDANGGLERLALFIATRPLGFASWQLCTSLCVPQTNTLSLHLKRTATGIEPTPLANDRVLLEGRLPRFVELTDLRTNAVRFRGWHYYREFSIGLFPDGEYRFTIAPRVAKVSNRRSSELACVETR